MTGADARYSASHATAGVDGGGRLGNAHRAATEADCIPEPIDPEPSVGDARRYGRAADEWPAARDGRGPSYEQQARVLSSLHDAGAALRATAGRCGQAASTLAETMEPMHEPAAGERRPRTSAAA